jgi:hypothetical protein
MTYVIHPWAVPYNEGNALHKFISTVLAALTLHSCYILCHMIMKVFHGKHGSNQYYCTEGIIKSTIFWDITPCSPLKVNQCFRGTYRLHLQDLLSHWYLAWLIRPWRWRQHVPPKRWLTFNGLHSIISHKTLLLMTTTVNLKSYKGIINYTFYYIGTGFYCIL